MFHGDILHDDAFLLFPRFELFAHLRKNLLLRVTQELQRPLRNRVSRVKQIESHIPLVSPALT